MRIRAGVDVAERLIESLDVCRRNGEELIVGEMRVHRVPAQGEIRGIDLKIETGRNNALVLLLHRAREGIDVGVTIRVEAVGLEERDDARGRGVHEPSPGAVLRHGGAKIGNVLVQLDVALGSNFSDALGPGVGRRAAGTRQPLQEGGEEQEIGGGLARAVPGKTRVSVAHVGSHTRSWRSHRRRRCRCPLRPAGARFPTPRRACRHRGRPRPCCRHAPRAQRENPPPPACAAGILRGWSGFWSKCCSPSRARSPRVTDPLARVDSRECGNDATRVDAVDGTHADSGLRGNDGGWHRKGVLVIRAGAGIHESQQVRRVPGSDRPYSAPRNCKARTPDRRLLARLRVPPWAGQSDHFISPRVGPAGSPVPCTR